MKCDVLVAGAGPVGLAMAAELARYGLSVRIVDKAAQRTDKSKALVIWSRTLELMDRMGCAGSLVAAGYKVSAVNIIAGSKHVAHMTLDGVATPHPYALMLPQSETERLLEEYLNGCSVQVERSVELTRFADSGEKVVSTLRRSDGREETLETSWLIGCDGAHSTVRHQLGMQFIGKTLPTDWLLADIHLNGVPRPGEVEIDWHSDGVLAVFPMSQDRYRVVADVGNAGNDTARPDPSLEEVQAILDKRGPGGITASKPVWLATFRINERKVANYQAGRVFLAGDAAHIHSPAGGQGMNTGIQDACNLAWKLVLVSRGVCSDYPLLASYSIERSAIGDQVLLATSRATSVAMMRGEFKQSIRNHIASLVFGRSPVRRAMANTLTELSIGYPDSPLSASGPHIGGGPAAGERAPIREEERPVGAGDTPRFVLFAEPCEASARLIAQYANLIDPDIRAPFSDEGVWLIRPDGYTAVVSKRGRWSEVAAFLDRIRGRARTQAESV